MSTATETKTPQVNEADFDVFLTSQDEAAAYPCFFGQMVKAEFSQPDADGKRRVHTVFKPYAYLIEGELVPADDIKTKDGCLHDRGFFNPGDLRKGYTFIYKMLEGLKNQRVNVGTAGLKGAVGHEGWYRQIPGRFSNILPQMAPKNAPTVARPDDWDFEAWVEEHGAESAFNTGADSGANATGFGPSADAQVLPESEWENFAEVIQGKSQVAALRELGKDGQFSGSEPRVLNATIEAMMAAGFIIKQGGNYITPAVVA